MTLGHGTVFQPTFFFKPDFDHGMMACHDMFDMFLLTCLSCDIGAWHCFSAYFFFSSQTLTKGCWHVTTCLTWYRLHAYYVTWGCAVAGFGKLLGWLPTGRGAVTSQHP